MNEWMHTHVTIVSSTCFEHPSVHPQYQYQALLAIDQTAYMDAWNKCHKTADTSLPEDEHLDVRNVSKAL